MKENCRSCSNNLTRNYLTIRCAIWTPKMKCYMNIKNWPSTPRHVEKDGQYRLPSSIRCQYYEKDKSIKKEKTALKHKVTKIHIMVSEEGKEGGVYCGHCGYKLNELEAHNNCLDCGYKFEGTVVGGTSWYVDPAAFLN